jgi:hypothetical protein
MIVSDVNHNERRLIVEHQLWKMIVTLLNELDKSRARRRDGFSDRRIVAVYYWSVLHDRPVSWAVNRDNWPIALRRWPLPSNTTMSRRLRSQSVRRLLETLEGHVMRKPESGSLVWLIDGKPLPIGGVSKDRQSGYGRAARSKAKGYKLHALRSADKSLADWRLAPMNVDERKMANRMLKHAAICGYVVADANYDSNELHATCDKRGNLQLIAPRRYGPGRGHGHRKQTPGRLRSKEILENPHPRFGEGLLAQRGDIERYFGSLTNWGGGLTHLPPWVRGYRRVHRWVQAKLIIHEIKTTSNSSTYVT